MGGFDTAPHTNADTALRTVQLTAARPPAGVSEPAFHIWRLVARNAAGSLAGFPSEMTLAYASTATAAQRAELGTLFTLPADPSNGRSELENERLLLNGFSAALTATSANLPMSATAGWAALITWLTTNMVGARTEEQLVAAAQAHLFEKITDAIALHPPAALAGSQDDGTAYPFSITGVAGQAIKKWLKDFEVTTRFPTLNSIAEFNPERVMAVMGRALWGDDFSQWVQWAGPQPPDATTNTRPAYCSEAKGRHEDVLWTKMAEVRTAMIAACISHFGDATPAAGGLGIGGGGGGSALAAALTASNSTLVNQLTQQNRQVASQLSQADRRQVRSHRLTAPYLDCVARASAK